MVSVLPKEWSKIAYPKALLSIIAAVGGLAVFLMLASTLLVSQPIDNDSVPLVSYSVSQPIDNNSVPPVSYSVSQPIDNDSVPPVSYSVSQPIVNDSVPPVSYSVSQPIDNDSVPPVSYSVSQPIDNDSVPPVSYSVSQPIDNDSVPPVSYSVSQPIDNDSVPPVSYSVSQPIDDDSVPAVSFSVSESDRLVDSDCDLYNGTWIHDTSGTLYTNNSCPIITQMQNCQGNGRPDKDYENWRWKPSQCDLPRFDPKTFLELMRGKTLAFIGDSVARNQMESMLCILWQVEVPKNRGNKKMQRYYFRSTSTMIVRIWSSWLVHQTSDPIDFAPAGVVKLHLDAPDPIFMEYITGFDVIVLSSGHWFAKQSVYLLHNEIVGGQLWWPDKSRPQKINNIEAFGISVETILTAMGTHQNYTGLTIVRSFSPDHYEGGEWNTGGSCTGKVEPALKGELAENAFTNIMHEQQVTGFRRAIKKKTNKSKMELMDITKVFSYRHDGHPGPYRSPDPNKITQRSADGRPPPQDCLHWCMPGPIDTWNEIVLEIIRGQLNVKQNNLS